MRVKKQLHTTSCLSVELTQLFTYNKTTGIMLQLDQGSSGLAFSWLSCLKMTNWAYWTVLYIEDKGSKKNLLYYDALQGKLCIYYGLKSL